QRHRRIGSPAVTLFGIGYIAGQRDLYTPLGVANGILYVPLVLTALWFGNRNAPLFFAFACTVLLMLGFFAVRHDEA
ncbi:hypothetical protein ACC791_37890, partial [Rhizobium ruizarguesonis]